MWLKPARVKLLTVRMTGVKIKLVLSVTLLTAGFLAWGLVELRHVPPSNYKTTKAQEPISIIPAEFPESRQARSESGAETPTPMAPLSEIESKDYVVKIGNCAIPYVPIRGKVVTKLWQSPDIPTCAQDDSMISSSFSDDEELVIENLQNYQYCCYREVTRPDTSEIDKYKIGNCQQMFSKSVKLPGIEYFLTECTTKAAPSQSVQHRFHANVPLKPKVVHKMEYWKKEVTENERPISVAMIVLDSVSRIHAYRSLPRTLSLLLANMKFVDFKGFHVLGEPTMPNAIPLLLGASSAADFWSITKPNWKSQWDKFPFIWKKFSALNYVTLFAEDDPTMGTFNYNGQRGFNVAPTDYYPRPLFDSHKEATFSDNMSKKDYCFGNQTVPEFILNYHLKFIRKMHPTPSFSINWMCRPQHDTMEGLQTIDDALFNFFGTLASSKDILENTLLILTSDHGFWDHPYSGTHEGLLERRLPMLFMRLPDNLTKKHPDFLVNVQNNAHRITSFHDVHQTLIHLTQLASDKVKKRKKVPASPSPTNFRRSLFEPIFVNRTCEEAKIPAQVCACNLPIPADNPHEEKPLPRQLQLPSVLPGALPFSF